MIIVYPETKAEMVRCNALVSQAVKNGVLVRPKKCTACNKGRRKIFGHHRDYYKPLEVVWICAKCHCKEHRESNHTPFITIYPENWRKLKRFARLDPLKRSIDELVNLIIANWDGSLFSNKPQAKA